MRASYLTARGEITVEPGPGEISDELPGAIVVGDAVVGPTPGCGATGPGNTTGAAAVGVVSAGAGIITTTPDFGSGVPAGATVEVMPVMGAGTTALVGGIITPGALRAGTTRVPSTQSGPLRSMHAGFASGRLSVLCAATKGATSARTIPLEADIRFIAVSL